MNWGLLKTIPKPKESHVFTGMQGKRGKSTALVAFLSHFNLLKAFSVKSWMVKFPEFSLVKKALDFDLYQFSCGLQEQRRLSYTQNHLASEFHLQRKFADKQTSYPLQLGLSCKSRCYSTIPSTKEIETTIPVLHMIPHSKGSTCCNYTKYLVSF